MQSRGNDHYVVRVMNLAITARSPMGRRLQDISRLTYSQQEIFLQNLRLNFDPSASSRRAAYKQINPELRPCTQLRARNPVPETHSYSRKKSHTVFTLQNRYRLRYRSYNFKLACIYYNLKLACIYYLYNDNEGYDIIPASNHIHYIMFILIC